MPVGCPTDRRLPPLMCRPASPLSPSLTLAGCRYAMLSIRAASAQRENRQRRSEGEGPMPLLICRRCSIFLSASDDFSEQQSSPSAAAAKAGLDLRLCSTRHFLTRIDTLTVDTGGKIKTETSLAPLSSECREMFFFDSDGCGFCAGRAQRVSLSLPDPACHGIW